MLNKTVPEYIKSLLNLPDMGQIGYVVDDVYMSIRERKYNQQKVPWLVLDHDHLCLFRGKQSRCTLRIALTYEGPVQIELIQVCKGETIHTDVTDKSEGSIHHFGFMVHDLEQRLVHCEQNGVYAIQKGTIKSAGISVDYAYLDTSAIGAPDLILELIQWHFGPFKMPVNRKIFYMTCFLGSWTVFRGKVIR